MIIDKTDIDKIDLKELRKLMKQRIKDYGSIKIEYDGKDIIIIDTLINELYQVARLLDVDNDINFTPTRTIFLEYDPSLCFMKIRLKNILSSESFFNLDLLTSQFKRKYGFVVSMFDAVISGALTINTN